MFQKPTKVIVFCLIGCLLCWTFCLTVIISCPTVFLSYRAFCLVPEKNCFKPWDNASCTLFTAMVHFKDMKDNLLKKKPFVIVSDYMSHNKCAVSKFLSIISDQFSESQPDLIINEWFLHSGGTAQHFK